MKKARILSLLLAAVMTASAMPTFAVAAAAAEPADGVITASGAITEVAAEDGYLSMGGRTDRWHSLQYQYNFKYGTKYRITFDGRQSVPSDKSLSMRAQASESGTTYYQSWARPAYWKDKNAGTVNDLVGKDIISANGFHWIMPDIGSVSDKNIAKNAQWKVDYPAGETMPAEAVYNTYWHGDNIHQATYSNTCTWATNTYEFQFRDKPEGAASDTFLGRFAFAGGTNSIFTQPIDIDNFKLEVYENDTWKELENYDFDTTAPMAAYNSTASGVFKLGYQAQPANTSIAKAFVLTTSDDSAFSRVAKFDGTNTTVTYTPNTAVTLAPGIYEISADVRYAASVQSGSPKDYTTVALTATVGGENTALASATVYNGWATLAGSVLVLEETAVSDIKLAASSAAPLDVKDFAITSTSSFDHLDLDVLGTAVEPAMSESGSNLVLSYAVDNAELTNGIYAVTASANGAAGNYTADVAYTLNNDSVVTKNVSFNTADETVLTYVSLVDGATVKNVTITADANALAGSKFAVKYIEGFKSEVSTDEDVTIFDIPEEALDLGDASLSAARYDSFEEGNKYVRLYGRNNNWAGITFDFSGVKFDADKDYFLEFDARAASSVTNLGKSLFGFHSDAKGRLTSLEFTTDGEKYDTAWIKNFTNDDWFYVNVPYTQTSYAVSEIKTMNLIGRYGWDESNPFDFDNFGIYYMNGEQKVYVYEEDFEDENVGEIGDALAVHYRKFTNNGAWACDVAVEEDKIYYTTTADTIKYEFAEGEITLERGIYTLNADFATPVFDYSKLFKDANSNAIATNGNQFGVTAKLTLSDGTTVYTDDFTATTQWTAPEIGFVVYEASDLYIKSVEFTVDSDMEYMIRGFNIAKVAIDEILDLDDDNLLDGVNASYTGIVENVEMATEGYVHIAERPEANQNGYLTFTFGENAVAGRTYYVGFDVRTSVAGETSQMRPHAMFKTEESVSNDVSSNGMNGNFLVPSGNNVVTNKYEKAHEAVMGGEGDPVNEKGELLDGDGNVVQQHNPQRIYYVYTASSAWTYLEGYFTPAEEADGAALRVNFNRGASGWAAGKAAMDIDNLALWYFDEETGDKVVVYENGFNTIGDVAGVTSTVDLKQVVATSHTKLTPVEDNNAVVVYDVSENELTNGVFTFTADVCAEKAGTAKVIYTLSDGTVVESPAVQLGEEYTAVSGIASVADDVTIESIKLDTTVDAVIRYKNVYLSFTEFETVTTDKEDNVLNNATVKVEGAVPNVIVEDDPDGIVIVGKRPASGTTNYLNFDMGFTAKAGVTYYVGFDIKAYADAPGAQLCTRLRIPFENEESVGDKPLNGNYVVHNNNSEVGSLTLSEKVDPDNPDQKIHDQGNSYASVYVTPGDWYYYEGTFTPTADFSGKNILNFSRGPGSYLHSFEVNNFVVWYMDGEDKVVVYENDFDEEEDMSTVTTAAGVTLTHNLPVTRTEYVPADPTKPVTITIEPNIAKEDLVDGAYVFSFDMKTTAVDAGEKTVTVTYTFADNSTHTEIATIGSEWTTVTLSKALSKDNPVVGVEVKMENPVAFEITPPALTLHNHKHDGVPNFGVVMMLLYKKAGGIKKVTEEVEFITNGDLSVEPTIHNEAVPKAVTVEDEGFWAKQSAGQPTTISYVTEKGNGFVRIKDLDAGQRGIWWNAGIELEPGTYTFKVDVRVSEQPNETNYTAYGWRDASKNSMMMRTILQNPNGVGSGNYAAFDPVDKDTAMNNTGAVTGTQYLVTRDWYTITDVIKIEQPTVIIFKIGGGMSGNPDAHGYDIDNLSLTGIKTYYKKNGVIVDPSELPEEVTKVPETPEVDGNLIVNGDFDEQPTVIAGDKYDESKANAWFQNDGTGYKKDNTGKDITTEPQIPIPHKITWTDGYLTFSGRTNNLRNFWYNSGVTVEPGTYKLTLDFKTAVEGQTSSIRCAVDKLFNPTVNDALAIDNNWKTMTIGFTANAATPIKLTFWGGPGASYIHDFCVDNITLVKVG